MASEAAAAAAELERQGISVCLLLVASVAPPPVDDLLQALRRFPLAVTVEAHFVTGGLGSLVAEIVAEHGIACRVARCGIRVPVDGKCGSRSYLYERHGLSREALVKTVQGELGKVGR
jgi:transketolase